MKQQIVPDALRNDYICCFVVSVEMHSHSEILRKGYFMMSVKDMCFNTLSE